MSFFTWLRTRTSSSPTPYRSPRRPATRRFRPRLEMLEDRALLTAYTAATAADLIADIKAADKAGGANTITLTAPTTSPYVLTAVDNTTNGANGLPQIVKKDNLTIIAGGDTIERSTAAGTPAFRLFDVASGASLTLENVTVENGLAVGSGSSADGGAVYNVGNLTLIGATLQNNLASGTHGTDGLTFNSGKNNVPTTINGQAGGNAAGGGIWSSGSVTLEGGTILQNNEVFGGPGGAAGASLATQGYIAGNGGAGGSGFGGGLYQAGGSVNVNGSALTDNEAGGGGGGGGFQWYFTGSWVNNGASAGVGGTAAGGGLFTAGGTLTVSSFTVDGNQARGGGGGGYSNGYNGEPIDASANGGAAYGGGIGVTGGAASLGTTELLSNAAMGGPGGTADTSYINDAPGNGGDALGGGLDAAGGTLTLTNDTATGNEALGGPPGIAGYPYYFQSTSGAAYGGGIEIASAATVALDTSTVNNTTNNYIGTWSWSGIALGPVSNIDGTYTLLT